MQTRKAEIREKRSKTEGQIGYEVTEREEKRENCGTEKSAYQCTYHVAQTSQEWVGGRGEAEGKGKGRWRGGRGVDGEGRGGGGRAEGERKMRLRRRSWRGEV